MTISPHKTRIAGHAGARRGRQGPIRPARAGMTLIEMLVAISVLAVLILAVSEILVQSQRFISAAQENRRSHAMAFTIARIIRRDLRRVSRDGFLSITGGANPTLVFATAGPTSGINDPVKGDGSIICYAQQNCTSSTHNGNETYLWRPEYICNCLTGSPSTTFEGERVNTNFSVLRSCPAQAADSNSVFTLQGLVNAAAAKAPSDLELPPVNASQIDDLWQVLVVAISDFEVKWTGGEKTADGLLIWRSDPKLWTPQNQDNWTRQNPTGWPRAIKIRFKINDPLMPREFRGNKGIAYEVISTVGE